MARRFGKFNPRQPRDKNGKWTSKGGGSSARSKPRVKSKAQTAKETRGKLTSNAIGATASFAVGQPVIGSLYAVGVATNAYKLGSAAAQKRVATSTKLSSAQKRKFTVRRKKVDAVVGKIDKAQNVALAASFVYGAAGQAAGLINASRAAQGARLANGPLQLGRTAMRAAKPRRGVYKITTI